MSDLALLEYGETKLGEVIVDGVVPEIAFVRKNSWPGDEVRGSPKEEVVSAAFFEIAA